MPYVGNAWSKRGGDSGDAAYLNRLTQWASEDGLLHPRQSTKLPEQTQGILAKLVDVVSREEYAMASIFDVLSGQGKEGEGVGHRFMRELIGGTKLGNVFGLEAGDKEDFGEVLKQMGVGEGGRLSDLIGDNKVTKYFDPSLRGTAGMGLSVLLSPSTYVGIGLGGRVTKVMGKGGEIALSAGGEALQSQRYFRSLERLAAKNNIDMAEGVAKVESKVLMKEAERRSMAYLGQEAARQIKDELMGRAGRTVARGIERGIIDEGAATVRSAVRFGDLGLFGSNVRGVELFGTDKLTAPFRATGRGLEILSRHTGPVGLKARAFAQDADKKITAIHDLFNAIPRAAKKVPGLENLIRQRDARVRGSVALARDLIDQQVFGRGNFNKLDGDALKALSDAVEGVRPEEWFAAAKNAGFGDEWAQGVLDRWHDTARQIGAAEVKLGMQEAGAVANWDGRYISHVVEGVEVSKFKDVARKAGYRVGSIETGDVGRFAEHRTFDTMDELRAFVDQHKAELGPNAKVVDNAHQLMVMRMSAHISALADANFTDDMLSLWRATPQTVFRNFYRELGPAGRDALRESASPAELEELSRILSRSSSYRGKEGAEAAISSRSRFIFESTDEMQQARALDEFVARVGSRVKELRDYKVKLRAAKEITDLNRGVRRERIATLVENKHNILDTEKGLGKFIVELEKRIDTLRGTTDPQFKKFMDRAHDIRRAIVSAKESSVAWARQGGADIKPLLEQYDQALHDAAAVVDALEKTKVLPMKDQIRQAKEAIGRFKAKRAEANDIISKIRSEKEVLRADATAMLDEIHFISEEIATKGASSSAARKAAIQLKKLNAEGFGGKGMGTALKRIREQLQADDVAALAKMRPELRSAAMREIFSRVESLSHFEHLWVKYKPVLDSMGLRRENYDNILGTGQERSVIYQGTPLLEKTFKRGRLKGRKVVMPQAIWDTMERGDGAWIDTPEASELLKLYDQLTNAFKLSVTSLFPAFNTRNGYSNVFSSMLDIGLAALNPVAHARAIRIMLGHDVTLNTARGQLIPADAVRNSAKALDIWQDTLAFADVVRTKSVLSEIEAKDVLSRLGKSAFAIPRFVENEARMLHYITALERGQSFQDAAKATKQFLFDYQDLSDAEKNVARRIFPFYTWQRKATALYVRQAITQPGRLAATMRVTDSDRGPGPDYLPEYVRGDLKMKLLSQPGKAETYLTGIDLPVSSLNNIWAGGVGLTLRENLSLLSPFIKNPLEFALDSQALGTNNIKGRQWMGRMGPLLQRRLPQWAKDYINLREINTADGRTVYSANGTKTWLLFKGPFVGRLVSESVTAEEMLSEFGAGRGGGAQLLKLLSGLTLREYDLSEAQRMELKNKIRQMEALLLESGGGAEFGRVYRPKDQQKKRSIFGSLGGV